MKAFKGGKDAGSPSPRGDNHLHRSDEKKDQHGNGGTLPNYSENLLQLIAPYQHPGADTEELEYLIGLGMIAWNLMAMKRFAPVAFTAMKEESKQDFADDKASFNLVEKMMKDIEHMNLPVDLLINDYTIEEADDKLEVKLSMLDFQEFLDHPDEVADEEDIDFELQETGEDGILNRVGINVQIRKPFLDWLNRQTPAFPVELHNDSTLYLVDDMDSHPEIEKWLEKKFDSIFTLELNSWHTDETVWPQPRTYKMFREWFQVSLHTMVYDLGSHPLEKF